MNKYLGIDIGGTHIKYGIYDETGHEYQSGKVNSVRDNLDEIIDILKNIILQFDDIQGIGLSIPGAVNSKTDFIIEGGACEALNQIDLIQYLKSFTHLPMTLENDANCAALAEAWLGNGKELNDFICVTIGTGIGGGIIINRELFTGSHYASGEFGYMKGKNEIGMSDWSSTSALVEHVQKMIDDHSIDGEKVFELMSKENQEVINYYKEWIHDLSIGIYNIGSAFDPECILIGGGISAQMKVIDDIKNELKNIAEYPIEWDVKACYCRNDAGKLGAIYKLLKRLQNQSI